MSLRTLPAAALASSIVAGSLSAQSSLLSIPAPPGSAAFGNAVGHAGDVNGDGKADVIVGDWYANRAQVFDGATGAPLFTFVGDFSFGDTLGKSVGTAGDLDHDGCDDLLVGAPMDLCDCQFVDGYGRIYSGRTGAVLRHIQGSWHFGWSSSLVGDVNGDGDPDYVFGAPASNFFGFTQGYARAVSGHDGSTIFTVFGAASGQFFGHSVAGIGDVNGDGFPDVAVGAPQAFSFGGPIGGPPSSGTGSAKVLSGRDGIVLRSLVGSAPGDAFGICVAAAGDANQDGIADLLVGAPGVDSNGPDSGRALVVSGVDGSVLRRYDGGAPGDQLGLSVAGLGDVDNDGFPDALLGEPLSDAAGTNAGRARVVSGRLGTTLYEIDGAASGAMLGLSVAGGGDVDGDGFPDAILGSPSSPGFGSVAVVSLLPIGVIPFGTGTAGCSGAELLSASSPPFVGNAAFKLTCGAAPPTSIGLALVADVADLAGSDPYGFGALLHVDALGATSLLAFDFTSDAAGFAAAPVAIPSIPQLSGTTWFAQALWVWGSACPLPPYGISTSRGLKITVQ